MIQLNEIVLTFIINVHTVVIWTSILPNTISVSRAMCSSKRQLYDCTRATMVFVPQFSIRWCDEALDPLHKLCQYFLLWITQQCPAENKVLLQSVN